METLNQIGLDRVIALVASIGACLSAIAAFLSVRQTIKQRKLSYIPEIVIQPIPFRADYSSPKAPIEITGKEKENKRFITLHLENIGLGAALSVKYKWIIPMGDMVKEVNAILAKGFEHNKIEYDGTKMEIKCEGTSLTFYNLNQKESHIDYILPINNETSPRRIMLPSAYLTLYSYLTLLKFKESENMPEIKTTIPILELNYTDIGGSQLKRKFELTIYPTVYQTDEKELSYEACVVMTALA